MVEIFKGVNSSMNLIHDAFVYQPSVEELPAKRRRVAYEKKANNKMTVRFISKNHPKWKEWRALAADMQRRIDAALQELKNELRRMDGRVVETDHPVLKGGVDDYATAYTLDERLIRAKLETEWMSYEESD